MATINFAEPLTVILKMLEQGKPFVLWKQSFFFGRLIIVTIIINKLYNDYPEILQKSDCGGTRNNLLQYSKESITKFFKLACPKCFFLKFMILAIKKVQYIIFFFIKKGFLHILLWLCDLLSRADMNKYS